jgi:hypothetical protein
MGGNTLKMILTDTIMSYTGERYGYFDGDNCRGNPLRLPAEAAGTQAVQHSGGQVQDLPLQLNQEISCLKYFITAQNDM